MEAALPRLTVEDDVKLVPLGGSIAKGTERCESDVDLIVVVDDEGYRRRLAENRVAFLFHDVADYPGGYVEGRFLSREFVLAAAERGSEPTRHSFTGVRPVWGHDAELIEVVARIPVYPEADRERRIDAFFAQLVLNRVYFWPEGIRREDLYLQLRAATEAVLFGGRMVLAHHRTLFQNQKRLMETLDQVSPAIADLGRAFLSQLDDASFDAFCDAVKEVVGPRTVDLNSRFTQDSEMSWFNGTHSVAEW
jgi:hypothetical protein